VTANKSTLEKAVKLSTGLSQELAKILSVADHIRDELVKKENVQTVKNIDEELQWIEVNI
jgi:hypothetical protein